MESGQGHVVHHRIIARLTFLVGSAMTRYSDFDDEMTMKRWCDSAMMMMIMHWRDNEMAVVRWYDKAIAR